MPCGNSADNRESGENPERSGHCEKGVSPKYAIGCKLSVLTDSVHLRRLGRDADLQVRKPAVKIYW